MNCDVCNKAPAKLFVTKIVNNDVSKMKLCESCAREKHLEASFEDNTSFEQLIGELLPLTGLMHATEHLEEPEPPHATCPQCGLSYEKFKSKKRLGCEVCYETFSDKLVEILDEVHGSRIHCGKVPQSAREEVERVRKITVLRDSIKAAVREERYEEAAQLRDEIERMEGMECHCVG